MFRRDCSFEGRSFAPPRQTSLGGIHSLGPKQVGTTVAARFSNALSETISSPILKLMIKLTNISTGVTWKLSVFMSKKNRKKRNFFSQRHTPLTKHSKVGSTLKSPVSDLNIQPLDWPRDLLPDHIWIASLAVHFGLEKFHQSYTAFLDVIDELITESNNRPFLGLISDFARIEENKREEFIHERKDLIEKVFLEPLGRILAFYPESPASWLVANTWLEREGSLNPIVEMQRLRKIVVQLMPGKDEFAGRVRALPLARLLKHNKVYFSKHIAVIDLLPKYPVNLNRDEQYQVESTARQMVNVLLMQEQRKTDGNYFKWSKYFWQHNFDLTVCQKRPVPLVGEKRVSSYEIVKIVNMLSQNSKIGRDYLEQLNNRIRIDLYKPTRDEVLFGLFSRITRLFCLFCQNPNLWARDIGGVFLRCLADTAITFGYLATKGSLTDFEKFVKYGEGQQKLLMLHLQDNYPDSLSPEGLSSEEISETLGGFLPELVDIELGHWAGKDTRKLAQEAGLEKLYRIIYTPTSSDVHGTWMSLKSSNLIFCSEPLHRYHKLPSYSEPPFFINIVSIAIELYERCIEIAIRVLGYPSLTVNLQKLSIEQSENDKVKEGKSTSKSPPS